jgi:hypothetical protein
MTRGLLIMALGLAACSDDTGSKGCGGTVTTATSSSAGTVMITGNFPAGQPIMEIMKSDGTNMDVPAGDYTGTTATFTGLPSGTLNVGWILSCDNAGQVTMPGPSTVTVP